MTRFKVSEEEQMRLEMEMAMEDFEHYKEYKKAARKAQTRDFFKKALITVLVIGGLIGVLYLLDYLSFS